MASTHTAVNPPWCTAHRTSARLFWSSMRSMIAAVAAILLSPAAAKAIDVESISINVPVDLSKFDQGDIFAANEEFDGNCWYMHPSWLRFKPGYAPGSTCPDFPTSCKSECTQLWRTEPWTERCGWPACVGCIECDNSTLVGTWDGKESSGLVRTMTNGDSCDGKTSKSLSGTLGFFESTTAADVTFTAALENCQWTVRLKTPINRLTTLQVSSPSPPPFRKPSVLSKAESSVSNEKGSRPAALDSQ